MVGETTASAFCLEAIRSTTGVMIAAAVNAALIATGSDDLATTTTLVPSGRVFVVVVTVQAHRAMDRITTIGFMVLWGGGFNNFLLNFHGWIKDSERIKINTGF